MTMEKAALNRLAKILNTTTRTFSRGGSDLGSGVNKAFAAARDAVMSKGVRNSVVVRKATAAKAAQGGKISGRQATNLVNGPGEDLLATTTVRQRLASKRQELGLAAANGNRATQIANVNAMRQAKAGGHSFLPQAVAPAGHSSAANANTINQALSKARSGEHSHLTFGGGSVGGISTGAAAPTTKFDLSAMKGKVVDFAKQHKGKLAGGAAAGAGAVYLKNRNNDQSGMYQEKWASEMQNKYLNYLEKLANENSSRAIDEELASITVPAAIGAYGGGRLGASYGRGKSIDHQVKALLKLKNAQQFANALPTISRDGARMVTKSKAIGALTGAALGAGLGYGTYRGFKNDD